MKYIVVDVDGVLNSFKPTEDSRRHTGSVNGLNLQLNLSEKHGRWLLNLAEETNAALIWGTTWEHHANTQIGPKIGLPELPVPPFGVCKFSQTNADWKSAGVLKYVQDNPFVWFDDDRQLSYYLQGTNGHLVPVDRNTGLTEAEVNLARKILNNM